MSSASRSGCSSRISSTVMPSATIATTVATGNGGRAHTALPHSFRIDSDARERHRVQAAPCPAEGREATRQLQLDRRHVTVSRLVFTLRVPFGPGGSRWRR